jgi:hypothetical protein
VVERDPRSRRGSGGIFCGLIRRRIRKTFFIKGDMPRYDDTTGLQVETAVAFVLARVAEKNAAEGARGELVIGGGKGVGETKTTKYAKVVIGWFLAVETIMWCLKGDGTAWANVEEMGGGVQGFNPKG